MKRNELVLVIFLLCGSFAYAEHPLKEISPTRLQPGRGTVDISPLFLAEYAPAGNSLGDPNAWGSDHAGGWIGGIGGSVIGLWGAMIGIFGGMGKGRFPLGLS